MSTQKLMYTIAPPPAREFRKGDVVDILDRNLKQLSVEQITYVGTNIVRTGPSKRQWSSKTGLFFDGVAFFPFPSIRLSSEGELTDEIIQEKLKEAFMPLRINDIVVVLRSSGAAHKSKVVAMKADNVIELSDGRSFSNDTGERVLRDTTKTWPCVRKL